VGGGTIVVHLCEVLLTKTPLFRSAAEASAKSLGIDEPDA
jgi:hypothetical protein